ncbi:OLC1v1038604C1 [Oldenlandia corymbosa var. corymbosa]|uniref:OLC1v1038604C1 n=1 Tax=Oldenlandia corymbosa var. corymbosa TaxID=529605 RepID=A0AAV1D143_OLDCO|nr:OLC1v1038604C1 [Oldenlandia corymbosa var. corymbosa]
MNYQKRLIAAAKYVYDGDQRAAGDEPLFSSAELGISATLKPHQAEGLSWLIKRYLLGVNVVLGDEMGLGKTLQAISFLSYLKFHRGSPGPFLVLCPLSVTDNWASEVANYAPNLRILSYVGDKEHRYNLRKKMAEQVPSLPFDILLTTYDIAILDQEFLSQFPWHYTIIDEAQRLKNPSSVLYKILRDRFIMPRKLLMTGTPIQNNLTELWALMHFCVPLVFGTLEQFLSAFKEAGDPLCKISEKARVQFICLKYVLGAFMLRRTKAKLVESGTLVLPPLTEITVMAPMVSLQRKVYASILRKELPKLIAFAAGASNTPSLRNIVIQLRKACSHPYLFPGIEPEPYQEGEHLVQASGKLIILDQLLKNLYNSGHRVLIFSQMTKTLDILQDFLEWRKYSYERLDGSVRAEERFAAIRSFSQMNVGESSTSLPDRSNPFVFMISTRAGGVGLNLVAADTVIFYEQDWNPQVDKQALQRAHRIGQQNHVLAINLVTAQSVEEVIMRRAERKLQLSNNVIGEDPRYQEGKEMAGPEDGDLRSIILGLHQFDLLEMNEAGDINAAELTAIAEKVIAFRHKPQLQNDDRKFEVNSMDLLSGADVITRGSVESITYDPGLDEATYRSWVEKFKEVLPVKEDTMTEVRNRRGSPEAKHLKAEAARKKAEEKKLSKWEALGYHSLSIEDPDTSGDSDILSDSGSVHFVYGDCTHPSSVSPSEPTVIFSCVDTSGKWGRGGLFDALAKVSASIPAAYERASECGDLHLGDLHAIEIREDNGQGSEDNAVHQWVALAVVQSYNPRRKVPRSSISMPDLDRCLAKATYFASQNSASLHMPRIGYQDGSDRSEWYSVERLLRKYAALFGTQIFVYYYRRSR